MGTDLAKQLTEGKIDFTQFVSQFQAMIPYPQNQKSEKPDPNLTQPLSNSDY